MILKVNDLEFQYNSHKTLKNVSFSIQRGETTVILGPNGVGKTTLLKCLNSILTPQNGDILVKDKNIRAMDINQIAKEISYVAQKNETARITAFDAILLGRHPHIRYKTRPDDLKKVDAVIKRLDLSHLCLKYLDQMSGGELQKVSIARALVQQTDLLLLDEPTSSLDLKNQTDILGLIKHIVKGHNIAAVMTMHDLNTALRFSDQYLFLKDKTIYGAGKINKISAKMIEAVYGVSVEIVYHKGFPLVIPIENKKAA
ncbi:ABC transporter ATP-binding protein [Desulfobacula sp.]|uniref:ABC transporter ATP-binding protein n=1 Tax=Desulfobacula sp. TaxID=2593537 RepID=UPI0025BA34A7|nr:ABC transporter ATP-binding protein [Desulfobacula sp.]MBC2704092.1 ABC transporter ATP-binding protein [Desulfobacula sp.]